MDYVAAMVRVEGVKGGRDTRGHRVGVVTPLAAHHARLDISDELGEFGEVELAIWGVIIPAHHRLRSQSTRISGESTGNQRAINGQSTGNQRTIN
jgi:hypothetical protein